MRSFVFLFTFFFFFNDTATTEIYTLSLHDALPIYAAAELVDPGGLDRSLMFAQVSELRLGIGGEGAGRGAVRDAVAARRGGGWHQVIADGLAQPGAQPGGQPGPGRDGGQRLGESALLAAGAVAVPACLAP